MIEDLHARYCAVRNVKSAVFWVAFCALELFLVVRSRRLPERHLIELPFFIYVIGLSIVLVAKCPCFRERLVVGFGAMSLAIGALSSYFPRFFTPFFDVVRDSKIGLWMAALMVSITLLISSARKSKSV
jgi:hypothetical protein